MSTMVSARISDEMAIQGSDLLKKNGHTVTQLINAAYEYYLRSGKLPEHPLASDENPQRLLSSEDKKDLIDLLKASTADICMSSNVADDKFALLQAKEEKYAALA